MKQAEIAKRVAELLETAPPDLWMIIGGSTRPTLDLYLYLCSGLGISISVEIEPVGGDYLRAVATVTHGKRRVQADALGWAGITDRKFICYCDINPKDHAERLTAVQNLAIVRACRMYLQPYLTNALPSIDHALVVAVIRLYREKGYSYETMLQHASKVLSAPVSDLSDLTRSKLVEILDELINS